MDMNYLLSERLAILGSIPPQAVAATVAVDTGWIKCDKMGRLLGLVSIGVTDCPATVDLLAATSSGGANSKVVKTGSFTAIQDGDILTIDCRPQEALTSDSGAAPTDFLWFKLRVTQGAGTTGLVSGELYGGDVRYNLANTYNAATVISQVN